MTIFQQMVMKARARLANEVELCVLPNEERVKNFKTQTNTGKPVECVWNVPRKKEFGEVKKQPDPGSSLKIFYGGSLSSDRLPSAFLKEVVTLHPKVELHVVGYATYQHRKLLGEIEFYARQGLLKYYGPRSRNQIWSVADSCEAALCLMPQKSNDSNLKWMVGASNKPFDAMARGLAVVVSDLPAWTSMYLEEPKDEDGAGEDPEFRIPNPDRGYGIAINPESRESIQAGLTWMLNNRGKLWEMGERGRQRIHDEWNYERLFQPVLDRLEVGA